MGSSTPGAGRLVQLGLVPGTLPEEWFPHPLPAVGAGWELHGLVPQPGVGPDWLPVHSMTCRKSQSYRTYEERQPAHRGGSNDLQSEPVLAEADRSPNDFLSKGRGLACFLCSISPGPFQGPCFCLVGLGGTLCPSKGQDNAPVVPGALPAPMRGSRGAPSGHPGIPFPVWVG